MTVLRILGIWSQLPMDQTVRTYSQVMTLLDRVSLVTADV